MAQEGEVEAAAAEGSGKKVASAGGPTAAARAGLVGGASAQQASWTQGTFHSRTEARAYLARTPTSKIMGLLSKPNSAFERDLANNQIGIKVPGRGVVGFSTPTWEICAGKEKPVALGACR